MSDRPRILVLASQEASFSPSSLPPHWEVISAPSVVEGLARLQTEHFDGILVFPHDAKVWPRVTSLLQTETVLEAIGEGVAGLNPQGRILWANATLEKWCGGPILGKSFLEVLGTRSLPGLDEGSRSSGTAVKTSVSCVQRGDQYLQVQITPLLGPTGHVKQLLALCRDITPEVRRQQKLDAIHQAGRQLAALAPEQLAEMTNDERVELLKENIRELIHGLLHYDVIEIRVLDQDTGRLQPLLAEGMTLEAQNRVLYASVEGNGVTGYVAATGKSYVCNDTANDPHYLVGAKGAHSSLTVALKWGQKILGTFNVESPVLGAFGDQDVQFTEIFCRELAAALHTLELLLVEKRAAATQSIAAVQSGVALPVDEILTNASSLLDRWIGHEPEIADQLKKILQNARAIKQAISMVGEALVPPAKPLSAHGLDAPSRLKGLRVLVVDNDERVRRSAHSLLGKLGCTVETARDGQEALILAKNSTYDAMLADVRLPDMGGYEVFHALRVAQPAARVILMSGYGYDSSHSIVKARQEGLRFILFKPFRVEQMLHALESPDPEGQTT